MVFNVSHAFSTPALSSSELSGQFSPYDLKRLEMYSRNMVDYHLIMDLIPAVARMFFLKQLGDVTLSAAQCVSRTLRVHTDMHIHSLILSLFLNVV